MNNTRRVVIQALLCACALAPLALTADAPTNDEMLFGAVARGDLPGIEAAVKAGARFDARNRHGIIPLGVAVFNKRSDSLKKLLQLGAPVDGTDIHGLTSLMHAASEGDTGIIVPLLDAGAEVNRAEEKEGITPLMYAIIHGRSAAAKLLLDRGADAFKIAKGGGDSYFIARHYKRGDIAAMIQSGTDARHFEKWITVFPLAGADGFDYFTANYFDHNPATCFPRRVDAAAFDRVNARCGDEATRKALTRVYGRDGSGGYGLTRDTIGWWDHYLVRTAFMAHGIQLDLFRPDANLDYTGGVKSYDGHIGTDYCVWHMEQVDAGIPVYAAADGVVRLVYDGNPDHNEAGNNNEVYIDHGYGRISYYAHLRKGIPVKAGERVRAGQEIARLGSSGGQGPHLHFGIKEWDEWIDPFAGKSNRIAPRFKNQPDYPYNKGTCIAQYGIRDISAMPRDFEFPQRIRAYRAGEPKRALWFSMAYTRPGTALRANVTSRGGNEIWNWSEKLAPEKHTMIARWFTLAEWVRPAPGEWIFNVWIDGAQALRAPFTVVGERDTLPANRPPRVPEGVTVKELASCPGVFHCAVPVPVDAPDADFDRVKYRYEWKAGGRSARDVTIGAMGDYLPVDKGDAGGEITCSVKAFDGTAWSAPVVARSQ
ncbi:MAG TPA: peptidoglycan DD-metalloendopeptidase family protein [Spirochaetota bacterium]|nr:peptidoglycan DD-metalloendopeptidase family protein [Spirochaetota bacterium]